MVFKTCFANVLFICFAAGGESTTNWRYSGFQSDPDIFTTRLFFTVETYDSSPADWCYPQGCSINSTSVSSALVHCAKPGFHKLGLRASNLTTGYIRVVDSPYCYEWHVTYSKVIRNGTSSGLFRIWIFDPKFASNDELNQTAIAPSKLSSKLSATFNSLGQKPSLNITTGYRFNRQELRILGEEFVSQLSVWEIEVEELEGFETVVTVDGQSIALHDCFVRARRNHLIQPMFFTTVNPSEKVLRGISAFPRVVQMPCATNVAILLSISEFLFSQDYFATWREIYISEDILKGSEPLVQSVAFTRDGILLLLGSGNIIVSVGGFENFHCPSGLPEDETVAGIQTLTTCFVGRHSKVASNVALVWYGKNATNKLYLSKDGGISFESVGVNVSIVTSSTTWHIHDVQCHSLVPAVYLLLHIEAALEVKIALVEYNYIDETWRELETDLEIFGADGSALAFAFIPPPTQNIVVWSQFKVAVNVANTTENQMLSRNKTQVFKGISSSFKIRSVVDWKGGTGELLVLMSNNRLFYTKIGIEYAVELSLGETSDAQVAMMFHIIGNLYLLVNRSSRFERREFPLYNEVLNSLYPEVDCPYKEFVTNITPELKFLDIGEQITLWAVLIYPQTDPNDIILQMSRSDLLTVQSQQYKSYQSGLSILNKTIILTHKKTFDSGDKISETADRPIAVSVFPSLTSLTCHHPTTQVLIVNVGCPLLRHIKIRNCTNGLKTDNTIVAEECSFTSAFDGQIHVVIDLYDGDKLVSEVTGDYFVWEMNEREDYGYSATMAQAGCLQKAQTRKEMVKNDNNSNDSSTWNQNTYKSCFETPASSSNYDGDQPYEILNSSGVSRVTFSGSGLYKFKLKVLQPNLSFCELTAQFSVNVEKEPETSKSLVAMASFITVTVLCAILLAISYFFYRNQTLQIHHEDREQIQRLQELKLVHVVDTLLQSRQNKRFLQEQNVNMIIQNLHSQVVRNSQTAVE